MLFFKNYIYIGVVVIQRVLAKSLCVGSGLKMVVFGSGGVRNGWTVVVKRYLGLSRSWLLEGSRNNVIHELV